MKRLVLTLALTVLASGASAGGNWNNIDSDDCSSRGFRIDGRRAHVTEQSFDAPSLRSVKVTNAPVRITGGGRSYGITVCKASSDAADLNNIHVSVEGGELVTRGPDNDNWTVTYKITAPAGANLDVESRNGPLALRDLDGTFNVTLKNGPLSLHNVRGNVDAVTTNGPVSVDGGSGTMNVKASNGPISVTLDGRSWEGGSLNASTSNGPVSVKVARNFNSGVVVEARGRGPVNCRAEACAGQYRTRGDWDDDDEPRRFELGTGPQVVRISTVNGPLTIRDAD